ncbi:HEAT repeat-containing protein [Chryseobacterium taeanense]|uniref:HEAT repeat-containing protein n=1 Tax=Chryseobacterium taeanense TaxID=311334 RepID=A0A1G8LCV1_9FLAO|nr:HEAT repeat domain-containing protein [Chryseobacterium taeanense]SDI53446.1 HEAT repeat-containing protein [Chryseobacterium taeanense]
MLDSVHFIFLVFLGMLSLVLVMIIIVIIYSIYQYRFSVRISGWSEIINKKITKVIVYEEDEALTDHDFIEANKDPLFRNLFLQKLVDSEKKFSGAAKGKIKHLFEEYKLQDDALKKLSQKKSHLIAGGIQELTAMNVEESLPEISKFLTHASPQVYQEAQYALVNFNGFEGLHYLDTIQSVISEWQQLRLLSSITHISENSDGLINGWLQSSNDSVTIFTLKLIRKFQILSVYSMVAELTVHSSTEVRVQAVQTLLSLENASTITYLIEAYPDQPIEVQFEILKAIKSSGDKSSLNFLKNQLLNSTESAVKVYAAEVLFSLGQQEFLELLSQDESSSKELIKIIKHALQEKI